MQIEELMKRPQGSNADEWHLFLSEYLDNRATSPSGLPFIAVQIAEAIDDADGRYRVERDSLQSALREAEKALDDTVSTLEFVKTALPVLQCMTGKIGLDLGEAKSLEMQKAANESINLALAALDNIRKLGEKAGHDAG